MNTDAPTFDCRAILFDLDGVLVDSTDNVEHHWRQWAEEHGLEGDKVMKVVHGVRAIEVIQKVAPHLDADEEASRLSQHEAENTEGVNEIPGASELVSSCPDGQWAVVTSGARIVARARIKRTGIPEPEVLVTADDVAQGKPNPAPYLAAAERLGIPVEQCLVVEDTPAGIEAGHAAGMPVIAVPTSHAPEELSEAEAVVSRLARLQIIPNGRSDGQLFVEIST